MGGEEEKEEDARSRCVLLPTRKDANKRSLLEVVGAGGGNRDIGNEPSALNLL